MRRSSAETGAVRLGLPRLHLRQADSTNVRARELAAAGAPHGTLVTAGEQVAGRGRQGRNWSSPPGTSLSMSLIVRDPPRLLSLVAGVAVAETVDALRTSSADPAAARGSNYREGSAEIRPAGDRSPGPPALIKWPNDILIAGRKVAGILVEGRPLDRWAVLGIGINVAVPADSFPPELRDRAGTLGLPPAAVERALAVLLVALARWLPEPEPLQLAAVRDRDALLGQPVSWADGTGIAAGIDPGGRLLVDLGTAAHGESARPGVAPARIALDAGEVHLSRRGSGASDACADAPSAGP